MELNEQQPLKLKQNTIVVLSACETGRTNWRDIDSASLADYFIRAGARIVIATFWSVEDISTALLMYKLYEDLTPSYNVGERLFRAQIWLRSLHQSQVLELGKELKISPSADVEYPQQA